MIARWYCGYCGQTASGGDPECNCVHERTLSLIKTRAGAIILESLYDDFNYPFVYLIEKLKLATGRVSIMRIYVGCSGDNYDPIEKITVMTTAEFDQIKARCATRDNGNELVEEKLFTFTSLPKECTTRRGFFQQVPPGQEETTSRHFPESELPGEKKRLEENGWTCTADGIWRKINSVHKKMKAVEKAASQETEKNEDRIVEVCGYRVAKSPSACSLRQPSLNSTIHL